MNRLKKVVLVVEDEAQILALLQEYLEQEGYKVLTARNSTEAFNLLATRPALDLLITDYRLADGVTGVEIAEPALKLRPDLKLIVISGYTDEVFGTGSDLLRDAPVLSKPFTFTDLQAHIGTLIG